jgi:hypothetical protein
MHAHPLPVPLPMPVPELLVRSDVRSEDPGMDRYRRNRSDGVVIGDRAGSIGAARGPAWPAAVGLPVVPPLLSALRLGLELEFKLELGGLGCGGGRMRGCCRCRAIQAPPSDTDAAGGLEGRAVSSPSEVEVVRGRGRPRSCSGTCSGT